MPYLTRREWFFAGSALCVSACGRKKGTGFPGYAIVAAAADPGLSVIDLTQFQVLKTIELKSAPSSVITGAGTGLTYVLTPADGTVHLIDSSLSLAMSRRIAPELSQMGTVPGSNILVALDPGRGELIILDANNLKVMARHAITSGASSLDVSVDGSIAIGAGPKGIIESIDLKTGARQRTYIQGEIGQIRFRADGKLLMAADLKNRSILALGVPELRTMTELPLAMSPQNLVFNLNGGQLFISGEGMDGIAIVFPYRTPEVDQTILAGHDPGVMACSGQPAYLFVASASGSNVSILDIDTRRVIGLVQVGQRPNYIAVTPDDQYALVLDEVSSDMAVIHIQAIHANRTKSGASLFTMLPVGSKPVCAAIVPRLNQPAHAA